MEKLDKLDLNHNKIEKLVDYGFEGLPKLTSLSLDYNKISLVEPKAFSGLDGECWTWNIIDIDPLSLSCTAQLQTLSMTRNKMSSVPGRALRPLHQLITLHLNDNNITRLNHDTFYQFGEHIQNLWLQNNR